MGEGEPKIRIKGRHGRYIRDRIKVVSAPIEESTGPQASVDITSLLKIVQEDRSKKSPKIVEPRK